MSLDAEQRRPADLSPDDPPPAVLERIRPSARCRMCGDGVVTAVCSHCARLLCNAHTFAAGPIGLRALPLLFRPAPVNDEAATPSPAVAPAKPDEEGAAPTLEDMEDKPDDDADAAGQNDGDGHAGERLGERPRGSTHRRYCGRCAPRARPLDAELLAATTTAALGAATFSVQPVIGVLLLGAGVVRVGVRIVVGMRRRARQARDHSADLVLNPNLRKIKTRERIEGTVELRPDRRYKATIGEVSGTVIVEGNWSRIHRAEVDRYRRRTRTVPTSVAAGHLVLHGPGRMAFRPTADGCANGGPALVLQPRVVDQPVLSSVDGLGETQWHPEYRYDITPPKDGWCLPVWISPNIAADLDRHVLELHVQWCTRGPGQHDAGVPLTSIELLELAVPAHWGTIEHIAKGGGDTYVGQPVPDKDGGAARRTLAWRKIPVKHASDRSALQLMVRFSERIDFDHELTGRIEAHFTGAVSGLTRTAVYRTDGGSVEGLDGARKPITAAEIGFTLSLSGLRYQEQRAVPDRSRAEDSERRETEHFAGVVANHLTVALLTNNLADEGYSIIRIQENPAQPSLRPGAVNRLWDLSGRYYEGVYPIEFHLQLGGEETHKGQQISGDTTATLTVHGSFANQEMERRVVEEWTRLWKRIRFSLAGAGDGPRLMEQPPDAAGSELARLRNVALTELSRLHVAVDAGLIDRDLAREMAARITREFGLGDG